MAERAPQSHSADRDPARLTRLAFAGLAAALVFSAAPGIDLWVSAWFADGAGGFPWAHAPLLQASHVFVNQLGILLVPFLLFGLGWTLWTGDRLLRLGRRAFVFLALVMALGPGLLVNGLLKAHWGRARPRDVEAFGGEAVFSPALEPGTACLSNCSFVSGDVAFAASLVAFAYVVGAAGAVWARIALGFTAWIAVVRVAQGAHFLSDVVFAALFTLLLVVTLKRVVLDGRTGLASATQRFLAPRMAALGRWREEKGRPAVLGLGVMAEDILRGPAERVRRALRRVGVSRRADEPRAVDLVDRPIRSWRDWLWLGFLSGPRDFGMQARPERPPQEREAEAGGAIDPPMPPVSPADETEERRDEIFRRRQQALDSRLRRKA